MTATITDSRHIVLAAEDGEVVSIPAGQEYHVLVSSSGVITMRPKRKHSMTLSDHLRGLRGLKPERRRDPLPAAIEL